MIICSCTQITDYDIHAAIDWMRAADQHVVITPGKIYRALGKSPNCGGCIGLFVATMCHNANLEVPPQLCHKRQKPAKGLRDEGRHKSYRISEQSSAQ